MFELIINPTHHVSFQGCIFFGLGFFCFGEIFFNYMYRILQIHISALRLYVVSTLMI